MESASSVPHFTPVTVGIVRAGHKAQLVEGLASECETHGLLSCATKASRGKACLLITALEWWRQGDRKFKVILGDIGSSFGAV